MFGQKRGASGLAWLAPCIALCLVGCSESSPPIDPAPSSNTADAALNIKSGGDAYERFLAASDVVLSEGGAEADRMALVAEGEALEKSLTDAREFAQAGLRLVGSTTFDSIKLQQASSDSIAFYVCDDVSQTDLLDVSGTSLVKPDRATRSPWLITAKLSTDEKLRVSKKELWSGENFC